MYDLQTFSPILSIDFLFCLFCVCVQKTNYLFDCPNNLDEQFHIMMIIVHQYPSRNLSISP